MRTERFPCGCLAERGTGRERWVELCPEHRAEAESTHVRWAQEAREMLAPPAGPPPVQP